MTEQNVVEPSIHLKSFIDYKIKIITTKRTVINMNVSFIFMDLKFDPQDRTFKLLRKGENFGYLDSRDE